jgi:hypothetical protein
MCVFEGQTLTLGGRCARIGANCLIRNSPYLVRKREMVEAIFSMIDDAVKSVPECTELAPMHALRPGTQAGRR